MTVFSLGARLHLDVSSSLALSLPQSFVVAKRRQKPAPSSKGAEAAPPQTTEFASVSTGEPRTRSICLCGTAPFKMCAHGAHTLTFAPKGQNISHAQSAYFTAPQACFMWRSRASYAAGVLHTAKPCFIRRSRAYAATACSAAARFDVNTPSFIATALREALPPAKPLRSTVALPPTAFTAEEE